MRATAVTSAGNLSRDVTLKAGFDALLECRQELEHCIAAEHRKPVRNGDILQALGREMGRLNDDLTRHDGLFRTLSRGRV
jgi:hypothetical protein